ncbi:MAG: cell division protein FtsA [Candidatus Pacebacteria bacterium]|nr:cell division protein FtsA [Candidatus Paceibacterota bacterium]NUQ57119.1 cell division protein FtsA [Candidatus Paceibacter sp.]
MARKIITGLDIGSSSVRAISVEQKKDGSLHIVAAAQKESEGVRKGYITNLESASRTISSTIKNLEKISGSSIRSAVVSVGGISLGSARAKGTIRTSTADGEITEHDIKRLVAQSESNLANVANKKIIHSIPLQFKVDNALVHGRPTEMKGTKLEVETLFVTCLNLHFSNLEKTVEAAGLVIDDIIASPLATSCSVLTRQQKETGCVLVNIGASTVSVVVFEDGLPISLEVFPIGSSHITNDIALGLQVPLDEAEKMKMNYGSDSPGLKKKLADIIEARLNDIFEMIESHLKKINRHQVLPAGIIMTGSGSNLFNLQDIARASLRLPAKVGSLLPYSANSLNITAPTNNLRDQLLNDPGWSVALGLCVCGAGENVFDADGEKEGEPAKKIFGTVKKWLHGLLP